MTEGAVPKRQRTLDKTMGVARRSNKMVVVKDEDRRIEVVDVDEPEASSELSLQVLQAMMKV